MKNKRGDVGMKLNNRGFTLIEVLAVIVILSILMAIMVPNVGKILEKNKKDNYADLEKSIISAAKIYVSDNRYEIQVDLDSCTTSSQFVNVTSIGGNLLDGSKLFIDTLVDAGNLKTNSSGEVVNPMNKNQKLQLGKSYVVVKYLCDKKDYSYSLKENGVSTLSWS